MPDFDTRRPQQPDEPNGLRSRSLTNRGRRVLLPVALAAGAGLVPLVLFVVALLALRSFFVALVDASYSSYASSYDANPSQGLAVTWLVLCLTILIAGVASFSLPALALGANRKRALIIAGLCALGFGAALFFLSRLASFGVFLEHLLALTALVGTPALGSLLAVLGDDRMVSRILPLTLVAALAMYCASLFAYWLYYGQLTIRGDLNLMSLLVGALSWPVLPGVVAALRSY
jgi:hypothetical protein